MDFTKEDIDKLKFAMIRKYGKTSFQTLSDELGVSRTALQKAINNEGSLDKLRERIKAWTLDNLK